MVRLGCVCVGVPKADKMGHNEVGSVMLGNFGMPLTTLFCTKELPLFTGSSQTNFPPSIHEGGEMHEPHLRARAHCHRAGLWATPRASPNICVDIFCLPRLFQRPHRHGVTAIVEWVVHGVWGGQFLATLGDPWGKV